jgi:nicotinamidase-related amidase
MSKKAIIVVDMLNDFVTGSLAFEGATKIIAPTVKLLSCARKKGIPVIYACDSHLAGIDHELKLWGDHAIRGTHGAEVIPELTPQASDYVIPKRRYSAFFQTDLLLLLQELGVNEVIITGLHTHMCCRHTAADAYCYGFKVSVASDATNSFTLEDYQGGLKYLKEVYGADIRLVDEWIKEF